MTQKASYDKVVWVFFIPYTVRLVRVSEGGVGMRVIITLACTECNERNYTTTKNKRNHPDRMELKKHCPRCNGHRLHRETK